MLQINWIPLVFGTVMALLDVLTLGITKVINQNPSRFFRWILIPTLLYAIQPWIFLSALRFETLTVMNLLWDMISNIFVTFAGFFVFGERLGPYKSFGVFLSFVAVAFLSIEDGKWEDFLTFSR
jgi:drug/metabolite transporter (DMT)-like permease